MNLSIYFIFFFTGCAGIFLGIRFKNKLVLFPSIFAAAAFGLLILFTFLLISGIK